VESNNSNGQRRNGVPQQCWGLQKKMKQRLHEAENGFDGGGCKRRNRPT
jgi:hypothetical protein